jgi:hypothetical protein
MILEHEQNLHRYGCQSVDQPKPHVPGEMKLMSEKKKDWSYSPSLCSPKSKQIAGQSRNRQASERQAEERSGIFAWRGSYDRSGTWSSVKGYLLMLDVAQT